MPKSELPSPFGYFDGEERDAASMHLRQIGAIPNQISPAIMEIGRVKKYRPEVASQLAGVNGEKKELLGKIKVAHADAFEVAELGERMKLENITFGYVLSYLSRDIQLEEICEAGGLTALLDAAKLAQGTILPIVDTEFEGIHLLDFRNGAQVVEEHGVERTYNFLVKHGGDLSSAPSRHVAAAVLSPLPSPTESGPETVDGESRNLFRLFSQKLQEATRSMSAIIIDDDSEAAVRVRAQMLDDIKDPIKQKIIMTILSKDQDFGELYRRFEEKYSQSGDDTFLVLEDVLQDMLEGEFEFAENFRTDEFSENDWSENDALVAIRKQVKALQSVSRKTDYMFYRPHPEVNDGKPVVATFHIDPNNPNLVAVGTMWMESEWVRRNVVVKFDLRKLAFDWTFADDPRFNYEVKRTFLTISQEIIETFHDQALSEREERKNKKPVQEGVTSPKLVQIAESQAVTLNPNKRKHIAPDDAEAAFDVFAKAETIGEHEAPPKVKRRVIIDEAKFLKLTRKYSPEHRDLIRQGINDFNESGIGTFKTYHWDFRNGKRAHALRASTSFPGGVRVLVSELRTAPGEVDYEIENIPKRDKMNKKNGNVA